MALAVGVALAAPAALFVALFDSAVTASLVAVALLYPFAAYAVAVDDDPTTVLVPNYVLAGTAVAGALTALAGVAASNPLSGAVAGLVVTLPGVEYHLRHGDPVSPLGPTATLGIAAVLALCLLGMGVLAGDLALGAVGAVLAALAGVDRYRLRGRPLSRDAERAAIVGCVAGILVIMPGSVLAGATAAGVVLSIGLLAVVAVLAL